MVLIMGHQPLKIILISILFIMINGDILRLQPVTLPTFIIPPNVSTYDLVAANKIKIIGNDIIEKEDKDIIHIQSIMPKFNKTRYNNKRKKIRNSVDDNYSNIINVMSFKQPKISIIPTTTPLPFTITKRSSQITEQTENIIFNSLPVTTSVPKKVGPYLYLRPTGQPFEFENKFEPTNINESAYLYDTYTNVPSEIENKINYDQTEIPIITKKPKYFYEKPTGEPFEIESRFVQNKTEPTVTDSIYLYTTTSTTGAPSNNVTNRFGFDKTEPTIELDSKKLNDTHSGAPSEINTIISQNNETVKPILTDVKPAFVSISGGNGKFDIRTLRVLKPSKKRKHRKKKNRKMNKNILDNEIVKIKVN